MGCNVNKFYLKINELEDKDYLERLLTYNISLISVGLKPSITLTLCKNDNKNTYSLWKCYGEKYLESLGLSYIDLRESKTALVVLIYHKEILERFIKSNKNRGFLEVLGYKKNISIEEALKKLKDRYEKYHCPHELGIFLGYPLEDVRDFMDCKNKKCLCCGYWKVYNREEDAKKVFSIFDNVKIEAMENILQGRCLYKILLYLKDKFGKYQYLLLAN